MAYRPARHAAVAASGLVQTAKRTAVGSVGLAVLTLLCYRTHVDLASAIPLYLLPVVLQSITGDFWSAAIIAVLSSGCLDFFFTEPRFSMYVANPLNAIALAAFLFTALVITRLVSRHREEAESAKLQKDRLDRLYRLSQHLLAVNPDKVISDDFLEPFQRLFGIKAICAFDGHTGELTIAGSSQHWLEMKTRGAYLSGRDIDEPESRLFARCLRMGGAGKVTGAIGFEGLRDPEETTGSLAAITAALVERGRAFREATAAAAATQAEVYRSAILDALAHEFKTPLTTILAAAGGMRESGTMSPEQDELASMVESEAIRLRNLASRLLRTARLDREEIRPRMELVDVSSLITRMADQFSSRSTDRKIFLKASHGPFEVWADPELLRIALSQLLENACKYSLPGSIVTLDVEEHSDLVVIEVSNTGSSIAFDERGRIFERFYRGADAKRSTSGSGLGLYVARKIAMAHSGALDLEIQDRPKGRVTFRLTIPVTRDSPDPDYVLTTQ